MSEQALLDQYNRRKAAEFDAWMSQPAPSATNPKPGTANAGEAQGPPAPPAPGAWATLYQYLAGNVQEKFNAAGDIAESARRVGQVGKAGAEALGQTFHTGVKNVTAGAKGAAFVTPTPKEARGQGLVNETVAGLKGKASAVGQMLQGGLELVSALPAGVGAAVQKALALSTQGASDDAVVIPGGAEYGAGIIRSIR